MNNFDENFCDGNCSGNSNCNSSCISRNRGKTVCVITLNPGVDRIIYLSDASLTVGALHRSSKVLHNQGSKGANHAIMYSSFHTPCKYYSYSGGIFGELAKTLLGEADKNCKIEQKYIKSEAPTRLNCKVIDKDGVLTELNERGGPYSEKEADELWKTVKNDCEKFDVVVLSGSIPQGIPTEFYKDLSEYFLARKKTVVVDCDGAFLASALKAKPSLIKPNLHELSRYFGTELYTESDILSACGKIFGEFGTNVICTVGERGSYYVGSSGYYRITIPQVKVNGLSGAGDTYLSSFVNEHYIKGKSVADSLQFAAAASVAKVQLFGTMLPTPVQIKAEIPKIEVKKLL